MTKLDSTIILLFHIGVTWFFAMFLLTLCAKSEEKNIYFSYSLIGLSFSFIIIILREPILKLIEKMNRFLFVSLIILFTGCSIHTEKVEYEPLGYEYKPYWGGVNIRSSNTDSTISVIYSEINILGYQVEKFKVIDKSGEGEKVYEHYRKGEYDDFIVPLSGIFFIIYTCLIIGFAISNYIDIWNHYYRYDHYRYKYKNILRIFHIIFLFIICSPGNILYFLIAYSGGQEVTSVLAIFILFLYIAFMIKFEPERNYNKFEKKFVHYLNLRENRIKFKKKLKELTS